MSRPSDHTPSVQEIRRALKLGHAQGFLGVEPEPHESLGFRPGSVLHTVYVQAWEIGRQTGGAA